MERRDTSLSLTIASRRRPKIFLLGLVTSGSLRS